MKTITVLLFMLLLSACSNSSNVDEQPVSRSDMKGSETTQQEQTVTGPNNLNQNLIRQQTETTFRGINKQEGPGLKPPGSLSTDDNGGPEKK